VPPEVFRLLLDEGFPSPRFDPVALDPALEVVALRDFDESLVNVKTPDWYLYLRADEAGFNALVTGDLNQSGQAEEMWTLTKTRLSVVTWRRAEEDPVVQWGQVMTYLTEVRRLIREHGPSIVYLPSARLDTRQISKAGDQLSAIADEEGRAVGEIRREAQRSVEDALLRRDELPRFEDTFTSRRR
jgi:hypothetical protein